MDALGLWSKRVRLSNQTRFGHVRPLKIQGSLDLPQDASVWTSGRTCRKCRTRPQLFLDEPTVRNGRVLRFCWTRPQSFWTSRVTDNQLIWSRLTIWLIFTIYCFDTLVFLSHRSLWSYAIYRFCLGSNEDTFDLPNTENPQTEKSGLGFKKKNATLTESRRSIYFMLPPLKGGRGSDKVTSKTYIVDTSSVYKDKCKDKGTNKLPK